MKKICTIKVMRGLENSRQVILFIMVLITYKIKKQYLHIYNSVHRNFKNVTRENIFLKLLSYLFNCMRNRKLPFSLTLQLPSLIKEIIDVFQRFYFIQNFVKIAKDF